MNGLIDYPSRRPSPPTPPRPPPSPPLLLTTPCNSSSTPLYTLDYLYPSPTPTPLNTFSYSSSISPLYTLLLLSYSSLSTFYRLHLHHHSSLHIPYSSLYASLLLQIFLLLLSIHVLHPHSFPTLICFCSIFLSLISRLSLHHSLLLSMHAVLYSLLSTPSPFSLITHTFPPRSSLTALLNSLLHSIHLLPIAYSFTFFPEFLRLPTHPPCTPPLHALSPPSPVFAAAQ